MIRPLMLILAASTVLFSGCSTAPQYWYPRAPDVFTVMTSSGLKTFSIDDEFLAKARNSWTEKSKNISEASSLGLDDRQWVLDYIAIDLHLKDCFRLNLTDIKTWPMGSIPEGFIAKGKPTRYSEIWTIESCDRERQYFIHDDSLNLIVGPRLKGDAKS